MKYTENDANQFILFAGNFIGQGEMVSSAKLCIADAIRCLRKGDVEASIIFSRKSIAYSVGISHPAYSAY